MGWRRGIREPMLQGAEKSRDGGRRVKWTVGHKCHSEMVLERCFPTNGGCYAGCYIGGHVTRDGG